MLNKLEISPEQVTHQIYVGNVSIVKLVDLKMTINLLSKLIGYIFLMLNHFCKKFKINLDFLILY